MAQQKPPVSVFADLRYGTPDGTGPLLFLAQSILPESPALRVEAMQTAFLKAVDERKDDIAAALLDEIRKAREAAAEKFEFGHPSRREWRWYFAVWLMDRFWDMPHYPEPRRLRYDEDMHPSEQAELDRTGMLRTKLRILELVVSDWRQEPEEQNLPIYRFLISVYHGTGRVKMRWETDAEYERRKVRAWRLEERKPIEAAFREKTGVLFQGAELERMILDPDLPSELAHHAVMGRAREGGLMLARRDVHYARMLDPLQPDKRSEAALALHRQLAAIIGYRDGEMAELRKAMQSDGGRWGSEKIGRSEYVRGDLAMQMHDLDTLLLTVNCWEKDSLELAQDVFGRARRHVEKFVRETWGGRKVLLEVWQTPQCHIGRYEGLVPKERN